MKEEIKKIIHQPHLLLPDHLPYLEKIAEDFPYFQPAYFFLLKCYKFQSYPKYAQMLEHYIWHIFDKRLLYDFLHQPEVANLTTEDVNPVDSASPESEISSETIPYTTRRDKDSLQETLSETLLHATQTEVSEEFEKKILPEIDFELDESIEIIKPAEDVSEFSLHSSDEDQHDDVFLELEEGSFISPEENETKSATVASGDNQQEKMLAESSNNIKKTSQQFAIIDEFLEKLPHIKPQPVAETTPVTDVSQNSVEVHDDFMTETFARILVKQGSYDKAIEIYRKLILKFPEKNTYFASQIEEIEKIKNNPKQ